MALLRLASFRSSSSIASLPCRRDPPELSGAGPFSGEWARACLPRFEGRGCSCRAARLSRGPAAAHRGVKSRGRRRLLLLFFWGDALRGGGEGDLLRRGAVAVAPPVLLVQRGGCRAGAAPAISLGCAAS